MMRRILSLAAVLSLTTCVLAEKPAPTKPTHAGLERMKKLAGTWVEAGKDGKATDKVVSVIRVVPGANIVHETLFPGQPMEMISIYHLDGADLVMTHYCALGNQPRLKADPKSPKDQIRFRFVGGTNLDPAKDKHMHHATLTFTGDDAMEISGECWDGGKCCEGQGCNMKLVRKK